MGRAYASVMGPLAFGLIVVRGLINSSSVESTLVLACLSLFAFAGIGFVTGKLAAWFVEDAVLARVNAEMKLLQEQDS